VGAAVHGDEQVRVIDSGAPPERFARGWHCLGLVRDFKSGGPHQISAFGTELVVFTGEDGNVNVLNAFCPHMGGNLAHGQVKGNAIACPFHDWRWGGNGKCVDIPYARRVPPLARTRAWVTRQIAGQLFVWNDPQGSQPPAEVEIPGIPEYGADGWTDWTWHTLEVEGSHCREIVDNVVDMAHFFYVHYALPTYFKNHFEGHVASQVMHATPRPDALETSLDPTNIGAGTRSDASYFGPSYMIDKLWTGGRFEGGPNVYLINCHYPISSTSFKLQYGVIVKKPEGVSDAEGEEMAKMIADGQKIGFEQDIQIWKNKAPIDNPLLSEEDGPVYQLRRWYEQFYVDIEDVTPEMVNRFEFEIDTTRAVNSWNEEVSANLAAGRSPIRA
jgi:3-ketosteroid 9alpha-monooxygenase subunit A